MKNTRMATKTIAYAAVMTALVTIATMYLKIQTAVSNTNLGDSMIFLSGMLFGPIVSTIAGGIGSFLADLITYPVTMWFTLIIKGIEGLICGLFCSMAKKFIRDNKTKSFIQYIIYFLGMVIAAAWMVFGYYIAKAFMYGTPETALISLPKNCVQGALSIAIAIVIYAVIYPSSKVLLNKYYSSNNKKKNKHVEENDENSTLNSNVNEK